MSEHDVIYLKCRQDSPARRGFSGVRSDSILSESNHRISNHLALLASTVSLRASEVCRNGGSMEPDDVAGILKELSARIETIGRLHRLLASQPDTRPVEMNEFLRDLCETLTSTLATPDQVELIHIGNGQCSVDSRQVLPLSLIVTEAVTNSLKYAHPAHVRGRLLVGCLRERDGSLTVKVDDDGVGLPEDFDFAADGGLGSRTIRALARQIGATARYEPSELGTFFRLRVPPTKAD